MTPTTDRIGGLPALDWLAWTTRFVLFTGKGGVGKTTIASAAAVRLADAGHRVLLVSTDPASNLADVFQMATGETPVAVAGVAGLEVMDLDPQEAANDYRARVIGPYRGVLPGDELTALEEKLAGACTIEVAAFDTFARLLADPALTDRYDHVVFDTAPTGHTLRLLALPAAWTDYLGSSPDATSCLGPLAGLQDDRPTYAAAVHALADPVSSTLVLVTRPDRAALTEASRAGAELAALGLGHQQLVVNGLLTDPTPGDPIAQRYADAQRRGLAAHAELLDRLPTSIVPLRAIDLVGLAALRQLTSSVVDATAVTPFEPPHPDAPPTPSLDDLIDELTRIGHGVVLVTGKGGVGKTTIATRIATQLAGRGLPVHLSTTDPAGQLAHLHPDMSNLTISTIDPDALTATYVDDRLATAATSGLDQAHLDLLAEDLRSPCSQEVAVFHAFSRLLGRARHEIVVIDTAPTGHTLLLLDVTGAYHRQIVQGIGQQFRHVVTPLMRLQDPDYSRLLIVTLPETTPVAEAADLQDDLRRAGIEPYGWVVNASLAGTGTADRVLASRANLERAQLERVARLAPRYWLVPWDPETASGDLT
jgi:arsenite/tail-anchored protein-transporting ATPase